MTNLLKTIPIFENLNLKELNYLKQISILKNLHNDEVLFYQDDKPLYLHIVIEGIIEVYKVNPKGNKISLNKFIPFSFIAEVSNFNNINFPATSVSIGNSIVLAIDYKKFEEKLLYHPTIAPIVLKSMAQKVLTLEKIISQNLTMDATQRVAKYIYENDNCLIEQKHHQIAQKLNITSVTFSRILKSFKNSNILDFNNTITNKDLLKQSFS